MKQNNFLYKGGKELEISRLKLYKNRRKKRLLLFTKITIVFYLLIFSFSYLTGGTVAYFNTSGNVGITFEAGSWFDGSRLEFTGKGNQTIKSCPEVEISADIINQGFNMVGPSKYEVYYIKNGEPRVGGAVVFSKGVIDPLNKGEETKLSYIATEEGFYRFKSLQRDGYEGKDSEIWSEKIKVECKDSQAKNENAIDSTVDQDVQSEKSTSKDQPEPDVVEESVVEDEQTGSSENDNNQVEEGLSEQEPEKDTNEKSNQQNQSTQGNVVSNEGEESDEKTE